MKIKLATTKYEELNNIQSKLMQHIEKTPGVRYNELARLVSLANGVLTYHLSLLEKANHITVDRNEKSRSTRYYAVNIPIEETKIVGCIRSDIVRRIIMFILDHDLCTFYEIVDHTSKAPSTISWHLRRLKDTGIITSKQYDKYHFYKITNREIVSDVLYKYKETFADRVINNYTQMIDEL